MIKTKTFLSTCGCCDWELNDELKKIQSSGGVIRDIKQAVHSISSDCAISVLVLIIYEETANEKKYDESCQPLKIEKT